jgi:F0F1-type ATP synthase assembly protein I
VYHRDHATVPDVFLSSFLVGRLVGWMTGRWFDWWDGGTLFDGSVSWSVHWSIAVLVGWSFGWLLDCLVDRSLGQSII